MSSVVIKAKTANIIKAIKHFLDCKDKLELKYHSKQEAHLL